MFTKTYTTLFTSYNLIWSFLLTRITFLRTYYLRSENIWYDGFLFDFLQKKTLDSWIRSYVIYTGFLFSERCFFDSVTRLYNDLLLWSSHSLSLFETQNPSGMLNVIFFTLHIVFTSFLFFYILF